MWLRIYESVAGGKIKRTTEKKKQYTGLCAPVSQMFRMHGAIVLC